jgi:tetratricopeptide (TPR) repeat protein
MVDESKAGESTSGLAASLAREQGGDRAGLYLDEQTKLTRLQIEQIEEENATRRHILKLERASVAMKVAFELAVALIVTVVAIGLGAAIWSAANDNGLVVESFSVPPDLTNRGLTGDVIAAKLLDKLSSLQAQTVSNRAASSYANNWGSDIKLQIPDTGVSIGEFVRSLHSWLGHQTRITGEVYRTPAGLAVTARSGGNASSSFTGSDADLDKLMQQAAESVYKATQPYRYAVFLSNTGRKKEAEAAFQNLIANGSQQDRAWACIGLEDIYAGRGDYVRARPLLIKALAIKPGFVMAYANLNTIQSNLQHDEEALATMRSLVAITRHGRDPDLGELPWTLGTLTAEAEVAADLGDYRGELDYDREIEAQPDFNHMVENARRDGVFAFAFLHDARAMREAAGDLPRPASPNLDSEALLPFTELILGHPQGILSRRKTLESLLSPLGPLAADIDAREIRPLIAYALALSGDLKQAHALIDATPLDCTQCLRLHGAIDGVEKNWAGAGYWFERATRSAPTPPFAWTDWGRVLLRSGAHDAAIAKLEIAHEKGPHFADPLVYWGEALLAKHQPADAIAKFEDANREAPNWGRLHLKWGEALAASGDKEGARKQFAIASGLDLTPEEKGELAKAVGHG